MDDKLTPADPSDLAQAIAFALRFNRRKRYHEGDKLMADLTADHIVRYLDNAGYVVIKKPPAPGGGDSPGRSGVPER
ncbi:MAG TPA: hypothetical protein VGL12_00720 [Roseiarcus sp.]|jgi:hypothetical protein